MDLVLVVLLAEAVLLIFLRKRATLDVLFALLPGAFILLGVRAALTGAPWQIVALWLALSFPAHAADLVRRRW